MCSASSVWLKMNFLLFNERSNQWAVDLFISFQNSINFSKSDCYNDFHVRFKRTTFLSLVSQINCESNGLYLDYLNSNTCNNFSLLQ